jgi:hypothetical protein
MAVVTRYFGTASAGTGDATSWANRDALFDGSGDWSGIIKGFDFSGSDSLVCLFGPGTYTATEILQSAVFANPPTVSNRMLLASCDSSGNPLPPPDPDWVSAQPAWDLTGVPKIEAGNIGLFNLKFLSLFNFSVEVLGLTAKALNQYESAEWLYIKNTGSNTNAQTASLDNGCSISNCCFVMEGSQFKKAIDIATTPRLCNNVRIEATGTPTGGDRFGFEKRGNNPLLLTGCTSVGPFQHPFRMGATGIHSYVQLTRCMAIDAASHAIESINTNTSVKNGPVSGCLVVGSGGYGISGSIDDIFATRSRFRDNTSGNTTNGNDSLHLCETGAGTDADEFVDAANGDYRIKNTSSLWGKGIGAGDEPASGGGSPVTLGWAI